MKKSILFLLSFLILLNNTACVSYFVARPVSKYLAEQSLTHKEYMNKFKTKEQIIKRFGLPNVKKQKHVFEFFYYFPHPKAMIVFKLDAAGRVLNWKTKNVYYSKPLYLLQYPLWYVCYTLDMVIFTGSLFLILFHDSDFD